MKTWINKWREGSVQQRLLWVLPLVAAGVIGGIAAVSSGSSDLDPLAKDSDGDGIPDSFWEFYDLWSTNAAAHLDFDDDGSDNLQEYENSSDPTFADTDRDGFNDGEDAVPVSRAYLPFGDPRFIRGDNDEFVEYPRPDWCLSVYRHGGEWQTNPPAWRASACESNGVGSLCVDLDRAILTNNLVFAVHYLSDSNALLHVDLLDTNGVVVTNDLYGNLMNGSNEEATILLAVPTALYPDAAVIQLRQRGGDATVYEGLIYIDEDGDGLDQEQERQLKTSDYLVDSDGDGKTDYDEVFVYHTDPTKKDNNDGDDGDMDKDKHPKSHVIYVDKAKGSDAFTGRARNISGLKGPKKTVRGGLSIAETNDTIVIKSGVYNENLDIRGKDAKVVIEGNVKL